MTQYPAQIDIDALGAYPGETFTYDGGDLPVEGVSTAGDVNGDGYDDLIVTGRTGHSNTYPLLNFVLYGSANGVPEGLDFASLTADQGFVIQGTAAIRQYIAQEAGDLNGDGYDDIVVASSNDAVFNYSFEDLNVIYGGPTVDAIVSLGALDGSNGFSVQTTSDVDWQFAGEGDVNGDGIGDLVFGTRYEARVLYGSDAARPATSQLVDGTAQVFTPTDWYSGASSAIGDINGDGFDDMRVGEAVVFGSDAGFDASLTIEDLDGSNGFRLLPTEGSSAFQSVVSAGDVNGDGIDDFIIGSPNANAHGHIQAGEAYVVFGTNEGFDAELDLTELDGSNGFTIRGETLWELGRIAAAAGDVNGDGFDDVLVTNTYGDAYVVFGQATYFGASFDAADLDGVHGFKITSSALYKGITDAAGIGDFNGDGFSDLGFATNQGQDGGSDISGGAIVYGLAPDGPVTLVDGAADQTLRGGAFDDVIISFAGDDHLLGGDGNDSLRSVEGSDTMEGGLGDDEYFVFADHSDAIIDSGGIDTIRTTTDWDLTDYADIENVVLATAGDWHVRGNELDNRITGSSGNNVLMGMGGDDILIGGGGDDLLIGGNAADTMTGDEGHDRFDFRSLGEVGVGIDRDTITDFVPGEDIIGLGRIDADLSHSGNQAFHIVDAFSGAAGELAIRQQNGKTLVDADVDGDGLSDFQIELYGLHALTAGDFIL